jgi:hypothetical protein
VADSENVPGRFQARVVESYERPGWWYWHVIDTSRGASTEAIAESRYRTSEKSAEAAVFSALIRAWAQEALICPILRLRIDPDGCRRRAAITIWRFGSLDCLATIARSRTGSAC